MVPQKLVQNLSRVTARLLPRSCSLRLSAGLLLTVHFAATVANCQTSSTGTILVEPWTSNRTNINGNPIWQLGYNNCSGTISGGQLTQTCTGSPLPTGGTFFTEVGSDGNYARWASPCTTANGCSYWQGFVTSGTFTPAVNRMRWRMQCNTTNSYSGGHADGMEIGTYIEAHSGDSQSYHYYHQANPTFYPGQWAYWTINATPQHFVGDGGGNAEYPDPEWNSPKGGGTVHYFDGLESWYIDGSLGALTNTTCIVDKVYMDTVSGEPDAYVATVEGIWNPNTRQIEVTWAAPKNVPGGESYQVRYSTAGSLKIAGFLSGTDGGIAAGPDNVGYVDTHWTSGSMSSQPTNIWVAIKPRVAVQTAASGTPIKLTFQAPYFHPFTTGESVTIAGVCSAVNGTHTVTVVDNLNVTVDGTSGTCSYSGLNNGTVITNSNTSGFTEILIGPGGAGQTSSSQTFSSCDLNKDGVVNSTDYSLAQQQALGLAACSADLDGNGACTVVEVQRVADAANGGTCRVGP